MMATTGKALFPSLVTRAWLINPKRGLQTSSPRLKLGDIMFREVRDLGYAPKFKDERIKKHFYLPKFDKKSWYRHIKSAMYAAIFLGYFKIMSFEWTEIKKDMDILRDVQTFKEEEDGDFDKYVSMYEKIIDEVWKEKGVK